MDENTLEVTISAYDGDLWCQVMPFQVQSYSRHFQHLLSHIYMHQFCSNRRGIAWKGEQQKEKGEKKNILEQRGKLTRREVKKQKDTLQF